MDADASLKRLLYVLSERDIGLGHDDLVWLFETPETRDDMVAWVNEYLNRETLLSHEELELYSEYHSTETPSSEDALARPLEELDFETSIEALENGTAAIEQQCATLEAQMEAMKEIQGQNNQSFSSDKVSRIRIQSRQQDSIRSQMDIDRKTEALKLRLSGMQIQTDGTIASLKKAAQRQLDKDDRLLDGLSKLMSNVEPSKDEGKVMDEVEELCRALVSMQGTVVKNRANQIYLSALNDVPVITSEDTDSAISAALADELDSLIEEVDSVLDMVVEANYRRPILDSLKRSDSEANKQRQNWLSYVQTMLQQMTSRLQELSMSRQDSDTYAKALTTVSSTIEDLSMAPQPAESERPSFQSRPSHRAVQQLVLPATSNSHPALDLLRHHGISLKDPSQKEARTKAIIETAVEERKVRLAGLSQSTEQGISKQISEAVDLADARLKGLLEAVYAHSPYKQVHLADQDSKARLVQLDKDVTGLAAELREMELSDLVERERKHLDELLSRGDIL